MKRYLKAFAAIFSVVCLLSGCSLEESTSSVVERTSKVSAEVTTPNPESANTLTPEPTADPIPAPTPVAMDMASIPAFTDSAYTEINGNMPYFTESDYTTTSFEMYLDLDNLGRCVLAYACVGEEIMPTDKRGEIGQIKPSGWQTVRYDGLVDGNYLYNRCHLIGYSC